MTHWIDQPAQLQEQLQQPPDRIGLDTEFIRERTWWPQLALVQIAIHDRILLVDTLVPGMCEALAPLLDDAAVLKVMHSPSEDLVALQHACGTLPAPMFDTQHAAALAGHGAGLGYQKLVLALTGETLDKGETRSDWLRRPLSPAQLHYAGEDVRHLLDMHDTLGRQLRELDRDAWLEEDCERQLQAARDPVDPWPHLAMRAAQFLDAAAQARLLRLLRWRETHARDSDRPRNWILDNELAVSLAKSPPRDRHALQAMLDARPKAPRKLASHIQAALEQPLPDENGMPLASSDDHRATLKRMQQVVADAASSLDLPDALLLSRRKLEQALAEGRLPASLAGWRGPLLEAPLKAILADAGETPKAAV
ncbi:MAG: ribonuclease D [Pseudoxanthomonas suwonensis]|nr:ribonuclease D [Pseudoxanthomonas suwonensis]